MTSWKEVDRRVEAGQAEQAATLAETLLAQARRSRDDAELARALIRLTQLRIGLHGYETAARVLAEQPWPRDPLYRGVVALYYGQAIVTYARAHAWEIAQREKTETKGPVDLKAWTREDLFAEARRAYGEAWKEREALGTLPVERWADYLDPNNYPREVRGTLRDAVSYLFVELLADTAFWSPAQSNDLFRLDPGHLLADPAPRRSAPLLDEPKAHPLQRIGAILDDLEAWHASRDERAAVLEARLERLRRLRASFNGTADRATLQAHLEHRLPRFRDLAWWAVGQGMLATWVGEGEAPDRRTRAHALALEGWRAYPNAVGGRRCQHQVLRIEAPEFQLASMARDGAGKRSLQVTHRNLKRLHFRAYGYDLERHLATSRDYALLPGHDEVPAILARERPAAEWSVDLPATPDYLDHVTYVVPPMPGPGQFVVVASARRDFSASDNKMQSVNLGLSDLVLVSRPAGPTLEVQVLSGASGRGVAGAQVGLYRYDYQKGHRPVASAKSDADGFVRLKGAAHEHYFVLARHDRQWALDETRLWFSREAAPDPGARTLVYTDRSLYRPGQTLHWKLVTFQTEEGGTRFQVQPGAALTLDLLDPNGEKVASASATSNAFGSAAGSFTLPSGRLLGAWRLAATPGGGAEIRVEEYKRPTFEVAFPEPEAPPRLNRPAELKGEAKYYFGLPLVNGSVHWRVTREPLYPRYWDGFGWPRGQSQTIATGTTTLDDQGRFRVRFTPEADERDSARRDLSYHYRVTAEVTDEGGETRGATRSLRLGWVSVQARVERDRGFFRANTEHTLTLIRSDLNDTPRPGPGAWTLVALRQPATTLLPADQPRPEPSPDANAYRTEGDRLRPRWDTALDPEAILRGWRDGPTLARGQVTHDAKGQARVSLPALAPGAYRLRYETRDEFGEPYDTQDDFLVAGQTGQGAAPALPALLLAERSRVPSGETARFLVLSGLADQPLWFELYRDNQLVRRQKLELNAAAQLIEVPVTDDDRGGFGARLTLARDHQFMSLQQTLFVPWDDKELQIEWARFRDRIHPGGQESWRVTVRRPEGQSADGQTRWTPEAGSAELLAYMYDRSLDLFAPHQPPGIAALYPVRSWMPEARANLGPAHLSYVVDKGWRDLPAYPDLSGDRFKFLDGYGHGGPGMRARRMLGAMVGTPPPSAMDPFMSLQADMAAPAPAAPALAESSEAVQAKGPEPAEASPPPPEVTVRAHFAETAFWRPQLLTGPDGSASIEFQVPDSVTGWNVWVHAITKDLRGASLRRDTQSVKDLMARPYVPRFLREGDRAELKVVVNNASDGDLNGRLQFEILDPDTGQSRMRAFGFDSDAALSLPLAVKAGAGQTLSFPLVAPRQPGLMAFKVTAIAGDLSDGERRLLPVLPGRLHLVQSRFAAVREGAPRTLRFDDLGRDDDPTRINDFMAVTLDTQLFHQALEALPYLVRYPYECSEQTLNRFLSTGIVASLYGRHPAVASLAQDLAKRETRLATFDAADPNRKMALEETPWLREARGQDGPSEDLINVLDPRVARAERDAALAKLAKTQTALGGFPWWPGGPPSPYMTLYLVHGFSKGLEFGVEVPKDLVVKAFEYLHRHYREAWAKESREDAGGELMTFLTYSLSNFPDSSWTGGVFGDAERARMLDLSFRHWQRHSPYLKGLLALTLKRAGRANDARLVWDSVMDSARTTPDEGTFWAPEERSWLWYNDHIETHAFALRTLMELNPTDPRAEGLVHWLLLNKKLNHWKSTRATADVLYALVWYLKQTGGLGAPETARVRIGDRETRFSFDPDRYTGKRNQVLVPGEQVRPATDSRIQVDKTGPGPAFVSATWHFSTERLPDAERGDFFQVSRTYFLRASTPSGFVLKPLTDGMPVKVGDQIEVQLSLRARQTAEYVHLRDPRAAGLEPENATSRYRWDLGIGWYEEVRDSGTNFFFESLPAGEYRFQYRLRANMAGTFRVGPATVQSMYAPEFNAYSAGNSLSIGGEP